MNGPVIEQGGSNQRQGAPSDRVVCHRDHLRVSVLRAVGIRTAGSSRLNDAYPARTPRAAHTSCGLIIRGIVLAVQTPRET